MIAKTIEKIVRYKYSYWRNEIAPSVTYPPTMSSVFFISSAYAFIDSLSALYSSFFNDASASFFYDSSIASSITLISFIGIYLMKIAFITPQ